VTKRGDVMGRAVAMHPRVAHRNRDVRSTTDTGRERELSQLRALLKCDGRMKLTHKRETTPELIAPGSDARRDETAMRARFTRARRAPHRCAGAGDSTLGLGLVHEMHG
jgi:hypothetical protein